MAFDLSGNPPELSVCGHKSTNKNRSVAINRPALNAPDLFMIKDPIHQNLSTSFVDLPALVRHLRDLQFVGCIHIELSRYEADIIFTSERQLYAREFDHFAGRASHGEQALNRILERAVEPFGRIHVYRTIPNVYETLPAGVYVDEAIVTGAREMICGRGDTPAAHMITDNGGPDLNALIAELLEVVNGSLTSAGLSFQAAFRNISRRLAEDHPFLIRRDAIEFKNGSVSIGVISTTDKLAEGVIKVLSVLFGRMERVSGSALALTRHRLKKLYRTRQAKYALFGVAEMVEELIAE
jgi:hypothetical protein